jgi:hypothetical protein
MWSGSCTYNSVLGFDTALSARTVNLLYTYLKNDNLPLKRRFTWEFENQAKSRGVQLYEVQTDLNSHLNQLKAAQMSQMRFTWGTFKKQRHRKVQMCLMWSLFYSAKLHSILWRQIGVEVSTRFTVRQRTILKELFLLHIWLTRSIWKLRIYLHNFKCGIKIKQTLTLILAATWIRQLTFTSRKTTIRLNIRSPAL